MHGSIVLFLAALLENLFVLSVYLPGSLVILLAVVFSDRTLPELIEVGLVSWFGFMVANLVNYYLGKLGYYRVLIKLGRLNTISSMEDWLSKYGRLSLFLNSFHPNFLSIAMVCVGIARGPLAINMVIAGLGLAFWIFVWMMVGLPFLDQIVLMDSNLFLLFVFALLALGLYKCGAAYVKRKRILVR